MLDAFIARSNTLLLGVEGSDVSLASCAGSRVFACSTRGAAFCDDDDDDVRASIRFRLGGGGGGIMETESDVVDVADTDEAAEFDTALLGVPACLTRADAGASISKRSGIASCRPCSASERAESIRATRLACSTCAASYAHWYLSRRRFRSRSISCAKDALSSVV